MLHLKTRVHHPLEKGPAERGVNEQKTWPEETGVSSESYSRKYSLIQDQALELTRLQQKMKIGRAVSSLLIQHVRNTVKTFEELLSNNSMDHYMEQHFREQLAKGSQLAESLASKLSTDDRTSKKTQAGQVSQTLSILREIQKKRRMMEVLATKEGVRSQTQSQSQARGLTQPAAHHSLSNVSPRLKEQEVHPAVNVANVSPATSAGSAALPNNHSGTRSAQLNKTPEPGQHGSSGPWEEMRPQKMNASGDLASFSSLYRPGSKSSGADLLEKNLIEIQNLRLRLEESVYINDRLRERLEHVLSNTDQGKSTVVSDGSLPNPGSQTQTYSSGSDQYIL
ncbi:myomegalin-like [Sciurus carolinensis]|uniref:myomegalin-like n=1 Tax=Sciurus carolinensis TaxID=30640 RepID=UPI001FB2B6F2|nr:myomegalin-like [Sciurus carolinensis]